MEPRHTRSTALLKMTCVVADSGTLLDIRWTEGLMRAMSCAWMGGGFGRVYRAEVILAVVASGHDTAPPVRHRGTLNKVGGVYTLQYRPGVILMFDCNLLESYQQQSQGVQCSKTEPGIRGTHPAYKHQDLHRDNGTDKRYTVFHVQCRLFSAGANRCARRIQESVLR